ncbi:MAG TPA: MBL fold metallo-hydrolase [Longimicrobiaceae bacterium]|nr:MBL fold metallo-hydrolase [Longimicrobiaceae bacterium]
MKLRALPLLALLPLAACTLNLRQVQDPPRSLAIPTAHPWSSLVYLARTDSGVVVFDLGWTGAGRRLRRVLRQVGATPHEVRAVFLTHSHRDHVNAWREVRGARFHLTAVEAPLFVGEARHRDLPSRVAERVFGRRGPRPGEVEVRPFGADTAFAFGADTVRAFLLPGHTAGSAAYLFRSVLLVGDAIAYNHLTGFQGAKRIFTRDVQQSRASLASLFGRVRPYEVRWVCNAHGKCARPDSAFVRKVTR